MENNQEIKIQKLNCLNCKYEWYPRKQGEKPKQCPNCKVYRFEILREKREPKKEKIIKPIEKQIHNEQKIKRKSLFE